MQVWCDWQVTLCDPHLSALEVRFSRRCAIQIDVYLYLYPKIYVEDKKLTYKYAVESLSGHSGFLMAPSCNTPLGVVVVII